MVELARVLVCLLLAQAVHGLCGDWKNCRSCLEHHSWHGKKCIWCPVSNKCHMPGDKNSKCLTNQYITKSWHCRFYHYEYSPKVGEKTAVFSAVAYSSDARLTLKQAIPCELFTNVTQKKADCGKEVGHCSGFATASPNLKAIVIAFAAWQDQPRNLTSELTKYSEANTPFIFGGRIQTYFKKSFDIIWPLLKPAVTGLSQKNPSFHFLVTGHAYGGAIASMVAAAIAIDSNFIKLKDVQLYTFGQPRVGSYSYSRVHDTLVKSSFRVVHWKDPYPHIPACWRAWWTGCRPSDFGPYHHGVEIFYKSTDITVDTKYKKCIGVPPDEDNNCSNGVIGACFNDVTKCKRFHENYFGIRMRTWWKTLPLEKNSSSQTEIVCPKTMTRNSNGQDTISYTLPSVLLSITVVLTNIL